ncbi:hypothetical protein CPB83DRAFT_905694 [Crepidotus variabilis]|uniref:CCL2-like lectin domain-containing protein n=1 Tax=Crepidotus variabilis TaxID=179855 RepID=A0A9P6JRF3_9AGAR|nr:hypothetical protein CPB83DRAFT_905694 [Crepidotus variabilis]
MSKPTAGRYVIYSRVLSSTGQKLSLTYSGNQNEGLTITPLANTPKQMWVIKDSSSTTSYISPYTSSGDEVGWGAGPVVLPPGGYVWTLRGGDWGYTIQDGAKTAYWSVGNAAVNTKVSIGKDNGTLSRWIFEKA